jgi:hypothetical protein
MVVEKKYRIVAGFNFIELESAINKLMGEGWHLVGGISTVAIKVGKNGELKKDGEDKIQYAQALTIN